MSGVIRIPVALASARYEVLVGGGALGQFGQELRACARGRRIALVSDTMVAPLHAAAVIASLEAAGFSVKMLAVPAGEASKSWAQAGLVVEWLAATGLDRTDTLVALGGGVVGDLAGFCAAVYLRGIAFVQAPTTLLAQVDSSIGGKTAVDLSAGKNLAGAFIQPISVVSDTSTLETLPDQEWKSGLGEVVKSAVLDSEEFLGWLEAHTGDLLSRTSAVVEEAVARCVAFKAGVVAIDERESGVRESLNLGHTLGHAIEKVAGYGAIPHGVAVAEGIRFALRLSARVGTVDPDFVDRVGRLLDELGLQRLADRFAVDAIRLAMSSDKKSRDGAVRFVLPIAPGHHVVEAIGESELEDELGSYFG